MSENSPAPRRRRILWPLAFMVLNALGFGVIIWRIEAGRRPPATMSLVRHWPDSEQSAEHVTEIGVELGTLIDRTTLRPDSLRLSPPVPGHTRLREGRKLVFRPARKLSGATRYGVHLDPRLRGRNGELPPGERMAFTTRRLEVRGVSQAALEPDGSCLLAFEFSSPVSPAQLEKHLSIKSPAGSGWTVNFQRVGSRPAKRLQVRCPNLERDSVLVEIAPGLAGVQGPLGTESKFQATVSISSRLQLQSMSADFDEGAALVRVRMNSAVDAAAAKGFVSIDPPVKHTLETSYRGLEITGDFQSGRRYLVTLRPGLAARGVRPLKREVARAVWFPDRPAGFRFAAAGGYLSPHGRLKIPVRSTNVKKLELSAERLYASNLVEYLLREGDDYNYYRRPMSGLSTELPAKTIAVQGPANQEVETLVDLGALAGEKPRGVYRLELDSEQSPYWRRRSTVAVVTDLGAGARTWGDRALVWTVWLSSARPAEGVKVSVYSDRRQLLGSGLTDRDGLAELKLAPAPAGETPAVAVLERGAELSYLMIRGNERSRGPGSERGRPAVSRGYEAYVFTERGAYRPGDEVRLAALLRDEELSAPMPLPVEVAVYKPNHKLLLRRTLTSGAEGRADLKFTVPRSAPAGRYRARLHLPGDDRALGSTEFLVADYIPRTLRMKVKGPAGRLPAGKIVKVKADVEHLFGGAAKDLPLLCRARFYAAPFRPQGWKGYVFGDSRRRSGRSPRETQSDRSDAAGRASFWFGVPEVESPAALKGLMAVEVREPGGRALTEHLVVDLDPWKRYLGVKRPAASPPSGGEVTLSAAAVNPAGKADAWNRAYRARLYRVTWSYVLRRSGRRRRLEYEWTRHEGLVAAAEGRFAAGRAEVRLSPRRAGPHRLVLESAGACPAVLDFYVQGPGAGWATDDPEELKLTLDKKSYRPGETARLSVRGPFGGTVLLCAERERVVTRRVARMEGSEGAFEFTVSESWRPNVFLTATVVRPVKPEDDWRPHRASGAVKLRVNNSDRRLKLEIAAPEEVRPSGRMEVSVRVTSAGEPCPGAAVVLAAVDEGVLGLTGFPTPDPARFFYADRSLDVCDYDMFSRLAPDLARWRLAKPADPGGGGDDGDHLGAALARRLNPVEAKRVKTAVLWAGRLVSGEDGAARASFKLPEYVGELRLMALAASGPCFGSAQEPLKVRSPLMARPCWPRFLSTGDRFKLPVTVFNRTEKGGEVKLTVAASGPLVAESSFPVKLEVPAGAERTVRLDMRAAGVGKINAQVLVEMGEERHISSVELPVRPACPLAHRAGAAVINAGTEAEIAIDGDFYPGTAKCSLVVAGSPAVELSGAIAYLMRYPYGCVEQTCSRLVPLIYLRELAALRDPEMVGAGEVERLLGAGFNRLLLMQTHSGGLAMWPGGGTPYDWGSIYAADVLCEARKAGHAVPKRLLDPLLKYLQARLEQWASGGPHDQATAAYACYVLARAGDGRTPRAWMARLDEKFSAGKVPVTARFHLAAAYLAAGRGKTARKSAGGLKPACKGRQSGGCLDSPAREAAVMLAVLLDVDPDSARVPLLAERLRRGMKLGRWGTTQENAFALMALGKYARKAGPPGKIAATAVLPGGKERTFTGREGLSVADIKPGQSITVRAEGEGKLWAFWQGQGVPRDGRVKEVDRGIAVRRFILDKDDKPVKPGALVQGQLYRVRLRLTCKRAVSHVVVTDLLPAGLEIENPHLRGSAAPGEKDKAKQMAVEHVERRDDRLVLFAELSGGLAEYTYLVRAVTSGRFALAPVEATCMYDPDIYSVHGMGSVEVKR